MTTIVDDDAWLDARLRLLEKEKAASRMQDELAAARRALPYRRVREDYMFEGEHGPIRLSDLFDGRSQLIVQHFMFGPEAVAGCPICSFWADGYNPMIAHINQRDASFAVVSRGNMDTIRAYRERMGWDFTWVSSLNNSFNFDFQVSVSDEDAAAHETTYNYRQKPVFGREMHGTSVFRRLHNEILHTYSTYGRGVEALNAAYGYIDLLPMGRNENELPFGMAWVKRHDEYG